VVILFFSPALTNRLCWSAQPLILFVCSARKVVCNDVTCHEYTSYRTKYMHCYMEKLQESEDECCLHCLNAWPPAPLHSCTPELLSSPPYSYCPYPYTTLIFLTPLLAIHLPTPILLCLSFPILTSIGYICPPTHTRPHTPTLLHSLVGSVVYDSDSFITLPIIASMIMHPFKSSDEHVINIISWSIA